MVYNENILKSEEQANFFPSGSSLLEMMRLEFNQYASLAGQQTRPL
jgi:hypothetical protein